jgi:hypothetical protein
MPQHNQIGSEKQKIIGDVANELQDPMNRLLIKAVSFEPKLVQVRGTNLERFINPS